MTKRKKRTLIFISLIAVVFIFLIFLRIKENYSESSRRPAMIPNVVVDTPSRGDVFRTLNLTGDILAFQQANIFSKVSGNIEKIYTDIGEYVSKGKMLALIDTAIYAQNVRQALGVLMQAEANMQNAKMVYERNTSLLDQNLIARQDVDNSKTAYEIADAQREAASANYKNALTQLSYCKIIAPFSGYITKRLLDAGAYVSANISSPSSVLFVIMDIEKVKVFANIPEKNVPVLKDVKSVIVTTDAYPQKVFNAVLSRISEAVDLATRTMQVEINIDNHERLLKPGMFATVNLVLEKKSNVIVLPNNIILKDDGGQYVFKISSDSIVFKQYVKIGIQEENRSEIISGVNETDKIVTIGQTLINDKMKVRITK